MQAAVHDMVWSQHGRCHKMSVAGREKHPDGVNSRLRREAAKLSSRSSEPLSPRLLHRAEALLDLLGLSAVSGRNGRVRLKGVRASPSCLWSPTGDLSATNSPKVSHQWVTIFSARVDAYYQYYDH